VADDVPETMRRGLHLCFMTARCADGTFLQMCARQDDQFRAWLRALGLDALLAEPRYAGVPLHMESVADADELEALVRERMAGRTRAEWLEAFAACDVGADPFLEAQEFLDHPQLTANDRVVTVADPDVGPVTQLGPIATLSATPGRLRSAAPAIGSTSAATVLAEWPRARPASVGPRGPLPPPLAGITLVEGAHFVAGPLAGTLLAELGARVIKFEPLAGDPFRRTGAQSVKFLLGKESLALDLKRPEAQAVLDRLIASADAFVHGFRPRAVARLGLAFDRLAALNPRLVYVCASAYGSRGPDRERSAFHSTPTALSGAGFVQAGAGNPPVDDSFPDPGGALAVATAILLALYSRTRTGAGQYVETSMIVSAGHVLASETVRFAGRPAVQLPDARQHGFGPWYRLYACAEGWLFLAAVRVAAQQSVLDEAGVADAVALPAAFSRRPATEWVERLRRRGVPVALVGDVGTERWLAAQGLLEPGDHPAYAPFWRLPARVQLSRSAPVRGAPATVGEHTVALLTELGLSTDEIENLIDSGVAGAPAPRRTEARR
jgi:crotonobetainyl-CoA:carnitine CoA-transferase CaiB-like acyl-CoA transferase